MMYLDRFRGIGQEIVDNCLKLGMVKRVALESAGMAALGGLGGYIVYPLVAAAIPGQAIALALWPTAAAAMTWVLEKFLPDRPAIASIGGKVKGYAVAIIISNTIGFSVSPLNPILGLGALVLTVSAIALSILPVLIVVKVAVDLFAYN